MNFDLFSTKSCVIGGVYIPLFRFDNTFMPDPPACESLLEHGLFRKIFSSQYDLPISLKSNCKKTITGFLIQIRPSRRGKRKFSALILIGFTIEPRLKDKLIEKQMRAKGRTISPECVPRLSVQLKLFRTRFTSWTYSFEKKLSSKRSFKVVAFAKLEKT